MSLSGFLSSFIFGVFGFWLFGEGKRKLDFRITIIGVAMMIYPYFTSGPAADWGIGVLLGLCAYAIW